MRKALLYGLLLGGALLNLYPLLWMVSTSLKSLGEATRSPLDLMPGTILWENYLLTLRAAPFGRYFLNTLVVAGTTSALVVITSVMAGYALARLEFRGRHVMAMLVLSTMLVPFELALIPNFMLISKLGWYNTFAALIVPWSASAFGVFFLRQAFLSLARDYYDAARIDGCGHIAFLGLVGVPLVRPVIATVALFAFLSSYNALLWPLVVTSDESRRVVQVGLTSFVSDAGVRVNLLMCAATIVMLPTLALYFGAQRQFERSYLGAGLKE